MLLTVVREKILKVLLDIYPILSHIRNVNCIQGVTQNKQVAVVVHKVKVSHPVYGEERTHRYGSGALLDLLSITTNKGERNAYNII
jgi:hypothetical protein